MVDKGKDGVANRQLKLKLEDSDYLTIMCADCGRMTVNEYLGTTADLGMRTMRITCKHCALSYLYKLSWPDWKGLPATPPLDEWSLFRSSE